MSTSAASGHAGGPVSLADDDGVKQVLVGTVLGLWEIVNKTTSKSSVRRTLKIKKR